MRNIPETEGMINAEFLQQMKDGATFINTARGALVDEDALVGELQTGVSRRCRCHLARPRPGTSILLLPNCWITPHRAGHQHDEIRRMGSYAVKCLRFCVAKPLNTPVYQEMLATM